MLWRTFACGVILTIGMVGSRAEAQEQYFHVSAGYAHMSLGGDDPFAEDFDGWGMAARWRTEFIEEIPNLMVGGSFQLTFYDGDDSPTTGNPNLNESVSDVDMFSPTLDLVWHQPFGDHFFIEPGIGVGWAWNSYDSIVGFEGQQTNDGLVVRPGIVVGYEQDQWSVGLDFQYAFYWIDFGSSLQGAADMDDRHDEMYLGLFVRYSF